MIQIVGWQQDGEDYSGRPQREIFYVVINGSEKAVGRSDLVKAIKFNLPDRGETMQEESPTFDRIGNGRES